MQALLGVACRAYASQGIALFCSSGLCSAFGWNGLLADIHAVILWLSMLSDGVITSHGICAGLQVGHFPTQCTWVNYAHLYKMSIDTCT